MEHPVANVTVALNETTLQKVENKTRHEYHCNPQGLKVTTKVLVQSGRRVWGAVWEIDLSSWPSSPQRLALLTAMCLHPSQRTAWQ